MTEQWPPPESPSTRWREFTPLGSREPVRARQVTLWGKSVFVAEIDGEWRVWCPYCRKFKSTADLAAPDNGCPVGLPAVSGRVFRYDVDNDPSPLPQRRDPFFDVVWRAW
jgi:hypothetical protein